LTPSLSFFTQAYFCIRVFQPTHTASDVGVPHRFRH
jgi:hypothetical protein